MKHYQHIILPCATKKHQAAAALLKAGADTEATTDQLFTPLLIASFNGKLGLAKRLVAAGAKIEAKNKQQFTAACIAAQQGHVDLLGFLLDRSGRRTKAEARGWCVSGKGSGCNGGLPLCIVFSEFSCPLEPSTYSARQHLRIFGS